MRSLFALPLLLLLFLVPTNRASIHVHDTFLERVKLTTTGGEEFCTCSFTMVLDGEKVDVERSKVICEDECSGDAEDVELEEDDTNFYIIDAFSVLHGKGTIEKQMLSLSRAIKQQNVRKPSFR